MSTLAFDKQGKPFTFTRSTRRLLARFFPNPGGRGTCVAVLDGNGEQVYVDANADYLEFRKAVRNEPGLYRLDQCDEGGNEIDDAPAAYVSIGSPRNAAGMSDEVNPLAIVRDLASINAEVSKTIADRFAAVMEKTASLLDSAAGAGILDRRLAALAALDARAPLVKHEADDQEDEDDQEDDDETSHDPWAPFAPILKMVEPMLPQLGALLYAKIKELVSKNTTTPPAVAPIPAPAPTPAPASSASPGLGTEPVGAAAGPSATPQTQAPSPAISPNASAISPTSSAQASASSTAATVSTPPTTATAVESPIMVSTPPTTAPALESPITSPAAPTPESAPAAVPVSANAPPSAVRNALSAPTSEQWAHLYTIRTRLSPKEAAVAGNAIARMSADVLAHWLAELSALSIDDAVRTIRSMISQVRPSRAPDQE